MIYEIYFTKDIYLSPLGMSKSCHEINLILVLLI